MRNKVILIGRTGSGKTTLTQALNDEPLKYSKTQEISRNKLIFDTPGEYIETRNFGSAIALYSYESDIVCLLLSATEPYSLYSPNITCMANRPVIGIVTEIDCKNANSDRAVRWLALAGCKKIFKVSSVTNEGIEDLKNYLENFDTKKFYKTGKY